MAETAAQETKPRWTRAQWFILGSVLLVDIVSGMDRQVMAVLLQPMKLDLKLTDTQLGFISGPAFALCYAFSAIPIARFAERVNRAKILVVLVTFWSSAAGLCGAAMNFPAMALARIGVGLGEGGAHPICQSLIGDTFPGRQRGSAMSIYAMGTPIAAASAPLIGGFVAHQFGWRAAFALVALPGFLIALFLWFTLRDRRTPNPARRANFFADMSRLGTNKAFVFLFLAGAFNGIAITGATSFVPSFISRTQGLDISHVGWLVSLISVLGFVGVLSGGFLADRFGDPRGRSYHYVCFAGALLSYGCYMLALTTSSWPLIFAGLAAAQLSKNLKSGPNFAAVQNAAGPNMRATAAATFTLASNVIGASIGAPLIGALSDLATTRIFGSIAGGYRAACQGAAAPAGEIAAACRAASADGLREGLSLVVLSFLAAAACFWLSGRNSQIRTD